jgi:hypothetical protein
MITIPPNHIYPRPATVRYLIGLITVVLFVLPAPWASAQLAVNWFTTDGGGGMSTGAVYSVSGTIAQTDASGPLTNGQFSVAGGFWVFAMPMQTPEVPLLSLVAAGPNHATIAWSPPTLGWILQETVSLSAAWTNSPSGATNPVVITTIAPTEFYRLHKP